MDDAPNQAARIAELEAALRFWETEARRDPRLRKPGAAQRASECRAALARLRGGGVEEAGC